MVKRVGIPRSLFYYIYFPGWKAFFEELGGEVILSPPTNSKILNLGVKNAADEICLPVKLFFGHLLVLQEEVDFIFVPRMISVQKKEWICPKFLGLPDMVRAQLKKLPEMLSPNVNLRKSKRGLYRATIEVARPFTNNYLRIFKAFQKGLKEQKKYEQELQKGKIPPEVLDNVQLKDPGTDSLTLALLGHPYLIYDSFITMNLIQRLRKMGVYLITPEMISGELIDKGAALQSKPLFWTLNKKTIGAANYFLESNNIDGIIQLASFGCGPDALINEIIERRARRDKKVPVLSLNLDEHTGEAGLVTRLEAFIDMIRWRRIKDEKSNFSSHGKLMCKC